VCGVDNECVCDSNLLPPVNCCVESDRTVIDPTKTCSATTNTCVCSTDIEGVECCQDSDCGGLATECSETRHTCNADCSIAALPLLGIHANTIRISRPLQGALGLVCRPTSHTRECGVEGYLRFTLNWCATGVRTVLGTTHSHYPVRYLYDHLSCTLTLPLCIR
jgi:hypothetical protein